MKEYVFTYDKEFKNSSSGIDFHWWKQNKTSLHTHDYYEFFLVTKGEMIHTLNGDASIVKERTLFLIHPDDVHQFSPSNEQQSIHINLSLTPYMLNSLCDSLDNDIYHKILRKNFCSRLELDDSTYNYIMSLVSKMNMHKNTSFINVILKQIAVIIISTLYRNSSNLASYPDWFTRFLNTLRKEEYLNKDVKDIYKLSSYSQPMISRYFKKYTGETLVSYFVKLKLNYACNLLINTNFTVEYIAKVVGYSSLSHFIRIFTKYTGKSPTEYRMK